MLNMVLAIILDVYNEVRENSGASEAIWTTIGNFMVRLAHNKTWVRERDLETEITVIDRLVANLRTNLLQYLHVVWVLMVVRSLLFRSLFACLPWLFVYQTLSVILPL